MKNSDKITEYVLKKRDEYQEGIRVRNSRIRTAAIVCSVSFVFCVSALSFGYLKKLNSEPLKINGSDFIKETEYTTQLKENASVYDTEKEHGTDKIQVIAPESDSSDKNEDASVKITVKFTAPAISSADESVLTTVRTAGLITSPVISSDSRNTWHTSVLTASSSVKETSVCTIPLTSAAAVTVPIVTDSFTVPDTFLVTETMYSGTDNTVIVSGSETTSCPWEEGKKADFFNEFAYEDRTYLYNGKKVSRDIIWSKICLIDITGIDGKSVYKNAEVHKIKGVPVREALALKIYDNGEYDYYLYSGIDNTGF